MRNVLTVTRVLMAVAAMLWLAPRASAQVKASNEWRTGTTIAGFIGGATESRTEAATGLSIGWELLPHLTIDGSGVWTVPRNGSATFTALLGTRINLTPPQPVVPFVSGGVGLQRATFDPTASAVPDFYQRRMNGGASGLGRSYTFDDFAYAAGAGADFYLRKHLALRADARVVFASAGGATRAVSVYGLHLAYHFEDHPVTP
jgi:hypothetical protein